jgi:hypothetical protein
LEEVRPLDRRADPLESRPPWRAGHSVAQNLLFNPPPALTSPIPAAIERRYARRGSAVIGDLEAADPRHFIVKRQLHGRSGGAVAGGA